MRIGFDITSLYVATAGVFWYNYNLAQALLQVDTQNDYLLLDYFPIHGGWTNPPEVAALQARNSRVVHTRGFRHYKLSRWRLIQQPVLADLAMCVDRLLHRPLSSVAGAVMRSKLTEALAGVDVFHSSEVLLWAQPGARNVCTIHDLTTLLFPELHTAENRELQQAKFEFARDQADVVIVDSEATRQDVVQHLGIEPERVKVVHCGISTDFRPIEDQDYLRSVLEPLGLRPGNYILHVGTLEPRKNLKRLVDAYALLRNAVPESVPDLVLVGPTGWYYKEVFARVVELGLESYVNYVGQVPARIIPAVYSGALFFVYPSLYEGFGLPPLEAMACGVPVITSNVSSLPEVVGEAAILVNPLDTVSIAEAMVTLLENPQARVSLRADGLGRSALFSWEAAARETLRIYQSSEET